MKTQLFSRISLVVALSLLVLPTTVLSQTSSWLDQQVPMNWNRPGVSVPNAPKSDAMNIGRCQQQIRNPSNPEERTVRAAGWTLYNVRGETLSVEGVSLVQGLTGFDGMCRPMGYQGFVFVRGVFAGTISPKSMSARGDGALIQTNIEGASVLNSQFARYSRQDALCCPSRTSKVNYRIDFQNGKPLLIPIKVTTYPNRS